MIIKHVIGSIPAWNVTPSYPETVSTRFEGGRVGAGGLAEGVGTWGWPGMAPVGRGGGPPTKDKITLELS